MNILASRTGDGTAHKICCIFGDIDGRAMGGNPTQLGTALVKDVFSEKFRLEISHKANLTEDIFIKPIVTFNESVRRLLPSVV
jgi:hypothetical protein